tara:strand:- start:1587 stop:2162 length:576 start_codon:yes stop_codon:yes gene_type:complete
MIKIGIIGDIGSGKSFVSRQFFCPVFNADKEVEQIYFNDKECFKKLKKILPKFISTFPIKKKNIGEAILKKKNNLRKIINIVHPIVRRRMKKFLTKYKNRKMVILDIPLLLENKLNKKNYILVFIDAKKKDIIKNLKKRKNYNVKILNILKNFQLPLELKRKKSDYIIKNNFKSLMVKKNVKMLKKKILNK